MAQQPPPLIIFSPGYWVNTEINHDFHHIIMKKVQLNNDQFMQYTRQNTPYPHQPQDQKILYDDDGIVYLFFGMTKAQILALQPKPIQDQDVTDHGLRLDDITFNITHNGQLRQLNVWKCVKALNNNGKALYTPDLLRLLYTGHHIYGDEDINQYYTVDTGGDILLKSKEFTLPQVPGQQARTLHINILHSQATLGDSASKTLPDSKKYTKSRPNYQIHSWQYTRQLHFNHTVHPVMSRFISDYDISCGYGTRYKVTQTWRLEDNPHYYTADANNDNNITTTTAEINEILPEVLRRKLMTGDLPPNTWDKNCNFNKSGPGNARRTLNKRDALSLSFQKKRSGDHLQALMAFRCGNNNNNIQDEVRQRENWTLVNSSDNDYKQDIFSGDPVRLNPIKLRHLHFNNDENYVVTYDWVLLCYVLYLGENAVFQNKNTGTTIKFKSDPIQPADDDPIQENNINIIFQGIGMLFGLVRNLFG